MKGWSRALALVIAMACCASTASAASWAIQEGPEAGGESTLSGVSCVSGSSCVAVGAVFERMEPEEVSPLAEAWNGTRWAIIEAAVPRGVSVSELRSVSCASATYCIAVGERPGLPLAERWNGREWAILTTPIPAEAREATLSGVSCLSQTSCTAVGWYAQRSNGAGHTLVEAWNGREWAVQSTPGGTGRALNGVACTSSSFCEAVGFQEGGAGWATLILTWNGSRWAAQESPSPEYTFNYLQGVACSSTSACTAVGYGDSGLGSHMFVETWNGTAWALARPAEPAGATTSLLNSVACASATACIAVGAYGERAGATNTLAESWNGTAWSNVEAANPVGALQSILSGVACLTASSCFAVGSDQSRSAPLFPLLERYA